MIPRLKSLELHGYKTFASRTLFEFPGPVTAIVGPNGSGKSNIADALRWVLGEQSYSLMRGKKTEDMIFTGSEQRPRAGMASATIVFDNNDRWLDLDYTEVAVARRAYRDGSNEYMINGQRVRLKDVSELLAESGLAERTYTIIGQGLVDAALALKAEERRRLFEEAAGIGLYRTRREESVRRLEVTERNLERVEDILAELKPRLNSLRRQAQKAEEYEGAKNELREILREWYGFHWHSMQIEVAETIDAVHKREAELESARLLQSNLDVELEQIRERQRELRANLSEWQRELSQHRISREEINRKQAVAEERLRASIDRQQMVFQQIVQLEAEISLNSTRFEQTKSEEEEIKIELDEARLQKDTHSQIHKAWQEELEKKQAALEAARGRSVRLATQLTSLQAGLKESVAREEGKHSALKEIEKDIDSSETVLKSFEVRFAAKDSARGTARSIREKIGGELSVIRARQDELQKTIRKEEEQQHILEKDIVGLEAQLEILDRAEQSLAGYSTGVKLLIQASEQSRLRGALGVFGSFIKVSKGFEVAITAALGEFLDAMMVEGDPGIEDALALLEDQPARGALIPLNRLIRRGTRKIDELDGSVIGLATNLIEVQDEFKIVVDSLLGNTLIVRDRESALNLIDEIHRKSPDVHETNLRLVTLRGEIFHIHGQVTAGLESNSGVLIRSAQKNEIERNLSTLESEVRQIVQVLQDLNAQSDSLHEEYLRLEKEYEDSVSREEEARTDIQQDQLLFEQSRIQFDWQRDQRNKLMDELQSGREQVSSLEVQQDALKDSLIEAEQEAARLSAEYSEDLESDPQADLTHWETRVAVLEHAMHEALARKDERRQAYDESQQKIVVYRVEEETLSESVRVINSEIEDYQNQGKIIGIEISQIESQIVPAEGELKENEEKLLKIQSKESHSRQALNRAEHLHAQARIELARRQENLDGLRRRIEDDFGLVSFEYAEEVTGPTPLPIAGLVEELPVLQVLPPGLEETIKRQRALLRRMGPINPEARSEFLEVQERFEFLNNQMTDLRKAAANVNRVITELDELMIHQFRKTFDEVAEEFHKIFSQLFNGGSARLILTDPEDLTDAGIDIEARLPGRREQGLTLLSGGERSLSAVALVFALLRISPTPFCVLDEVDAMLDEANVGRFRELLRELSKTTQFILITHNRATVQVADVIYGVTMGRDSTSQTISLKIDEVEKAVQT